MKRNLIGRASLAFGLALALSASPALAQGKGKDHREHEKKEARAPQRRPQLQRRESNDDRYRRDDRERRTVPPGWCRGRGNPHNTPENCGYGSRRGDHDRYDRDDSYGRDRDYGGYGRNGSYDERHREFHRYLDEKYRSLAAQHPLDPRWQLRVSQQKRAEHERWHERMGVRHR
jgi:hypothetical protein